METADDEPWRRPGPLSPWFFAGALVLVICAAGLGSWWLNSAKPTPATDSGTVATLRSSDLSGVVIRAAELPQVDLSGVKLDGASVVESDLRRASLAFTQGRSVNLQRTCLRDTHWDGSTLQEVVLDGADLRGADLSRAQVSVRSAADVLVDSNTRWGAQGAPPGTRFSADPDPRSPCR